ncbi:sn-glycerol-3-phosphate ABC transporter ATP-binding protein UgpC [Vibrio cholerae]|uniref:ABC transporter ATP-binding protein n=1 Tax=Vibrio TaxID=662 RepID=UPI0004E3A6B1|nr:MULTISPECIES: sn-glycerol-3-phosphate ABC transporter ATP-binding protein UgpC [Vibrio]KFD81853.1 ABC transporter family protein [Vibrio paracholerae]QAV06884.1 ABC transporter ATP-binding protein [Vibrio cholerae]TXX92282.1 sn-glycerol-3-phosphate ABC transporter ATP-binding protein UgpC [Vibrio cholerae]TXX93520.1 sn-glycerol-3-phosphate ABC transporter ATP-binding protein UgpC [Vibrio cholerae]GHW11597.1 sn-glycerol-3-phosphate ABC transporter ATP-binding protein UgpC [Vibrio cholerae]
MAAVTFSNLVKNYGDTQVVKGIDLNINHGEFIVLLGPSGCGKSTTLRMLAGLEDITGGEIYIDDLLVNDLHPIERNIAMVFQSYALYPHMTVEENIGFSLENLKIEKRKIKRMVSEVAEALELTPLLQRKPKELSGGQRQRVAMGRAMVRTPKVFLFDEPLSNLDAKLRGQMRKEIRALHEKVKTTIIYVTHDQIEAMTLADRVVILNNGKIEQVGTPEEIFENPKTVFVARFIGSPEINLFDVVTSDISNCISNIQQDVKSIGIRPQDFNLEEDGIDSEFCCEMPVRVINSEVLGSVMHLDCLFKDKKIVVETKYTEEKIDEKITLYFDKRKAHFFDNNQCTTLQ